MKALFGILLILLCIALKGWLDPDDDAIRRR